MSAAIVDIDDAPILYATVPCFYAAIERARVAVSPDAPIIVGGDPRKRGKVQSASPEAERQGVQPGMLMSEALELCADARRVATDMRHYRDVAGALRLCLRREIEAIEPDGMAAAFLDVRGGDRGSAQMGAALVARVEAELGLPLSVGGAPTKAVARLAAEALGGAGVRVIAPAEVAGFLDPLEVTRLPGVGPRTAARLAELGVETVGALLALPAETIETALGNHGLEILGEARGGHARAVKSARHPQSLSRECPIDPPSLDDSSRRSALESLAGALAGALGRHGLEARRIGVRARLVGKPDWQTSRTAEGTLVLESEIADRAEVLLEGSRSTGVPLRGLRITLSGLCEVGTRDRQLDLFG